MVNIIVLKYSIKYLKNLYKDYKFSEDYEVIYNAKITDMTKYSLTFLKRNKWVMPGLLISDNFDFFKSRRIIINYKNSRKEKTEIYLHKIYNNNISSYFIFGIATMFFAKFPQFFFLKTNLILLKLISKNNNNDKNINLLNKYIWINFFISFLLYLGFFIIVMGFVTSSDDLFSYFLYNSLYVIICPILVLIKNVLFIKLLIKKIEYK